MPPKIAKGVAGKEGGKEPGVAPGEVQGRRWVENSSEDLSRLREGNESLLEEEVDFSPEKLDATLLLLQQKLSEVTSLLNTLNVTSLDEVDLEKKFLRAEGQFRYWAEQRKRLEALESGGLEECDSKQKNARTLIYNIWTTWDDLVLTLQGQMEQRESGVTTNEDTRSEASSVDAITGQVASLKLDASQKSGGAGTVGIPKIAASINSESEVTTNKDTRSKASSVNTVIWQGNSLHHRLQIFLGTPFVSWGSLDGYSSLAAEHEKQLRQEIGKLISLHHDEVSLRTFFMRAVENKGRKFRKTMEKEFEDPAKDAYKMAVARHRNGEIQEALQYCNNAIRGTANAIELWTQTDLFHTKLCATVQEKIRRWGSKIKNTLKKSVQEYRVYQERLEQIEVEKVEGIKRVNDKKMSVQNELQRIDTIEQEVETQFQNEVGTTCRVIRGNLATMIWHLDKAEGDYNSYNFRAAIEAEEITAEILKEVEFLKPHLETRLALWKEWAERDFKAQEIESDLNGNRSIWKMRFMGPLVRKENVIGTPTELPHEIEMAAEYLMVVLNPGQSEEGFCNNLDTLGYPASRLEAVSKEDLLYRLYFQQKNNSWLETMDSLKEVIKTNRLALRCYPDYMLELHSTPMAQVNLASSEGVFEGPVQQPWAFYHDKGLHLPARLFDLQDPLLATPPEPIKVAIIDSGVLGSIATGDFETHDALTEKIAFTFDKRQKKATGFGFNACDPLHQNVPEDLAGGSSKDGHGTHVAGIIAASHGVINGVAGLAGMPGFVKLIICKCFQPGSNKGFCSDAIKCIKYAEQQGAQVINCSWGGCLQGPPSRPRFTPEEVQDLENSIKDKSFSVVAAAGNDKLDTATISQYPCNFVLRNLVSVAGTNKQGKVPNGFSNFGSQSVHLAAPGKEIISTGIQALNDYTCMTGTSQAAPYVTAAAILAKIKYPFLTPVQLIQYLHYACNGGWRKEMQVKHGPLNVEKILLEDTIRGFLKSQKMTADKIDDLLNPTQGKRKNRHG